MGERKMCTAVAYQANGMYFGRTLDHTSSYGESVTVTPRAFYLRFREEAALQSHYAMIGMAHVEDHYPLYYDAVNEKGLAAAGLHFVGNAVYGKAVAAGKHNVAQFEFLPWVLAQCASVREARDLLSRTHLRDLPFSRTLPSAPLHWLIADRDEAITVEAVREGLRIYQNPVGVLTNNPPFEQQLFRLNDYMQLSPKPAQNRFSDRLDLHAYSRGMGAMGLPGDLSSQSRFVRASFVKSHAVVGNSEAENVGQFFHILQSVEQVKGCCELADGSLESTLYTSCMNIQKAIYYYTTYGNRQINAVHLHREDLNGERLVCYDLVTDENILEQN